MQVDHVALPSPVPGTRRELRIVRFGHAGARPKAYLQAALHADELPGILVLTVLQELLAELEAAGAVNGEIVLVPLANPIGLAQNVMGSHTGRYDLAEMTNFNRGWPDLTDAVAERVAARLGDDPAANVALIRAALVETVRDLPAHGENGVLRKTLTAHAVDADIVLDLHCDLEAVVHLYLGTPLWPAAHDLAADIGARAVLLAETSGGNPFDEAFAQPWWYLARRFPGRPIPPACLAATVEYRGVADGDETMAEADARALLRFLARRGVVQGDPGPLPALMAEATPLEGVAMIRAPAGGLLSWQVEPRAKVEAGEVLAVLVDPLAADPAERRREIRSPVGGVLFARALARLARAGDIVAKVAGPEPLPDRKGRLLGD